VADVSKLGSSGEVAHLDECEPITPVHVYPIQSSFTSRNASPVKVKDTLESEEDMRCVKDDETTYKPPEGNAGTMKLMHICDINPEVMLKRSCLLEGESSKPRGSCTQTSLNHHGLTQMLRHSRCANSLSSNSSSCIDIRNCNRLFWLRNSPDEASRLWNIGKQIGFNSVEFDDCVIAQILELEKLELGMGLDRV